MKTLLLTNGPTRPTRFDIFDIARDEESGRFPRITCANGVSLSVQGHSFNYCEPRVTLPNLADYTEVEVGFVRDPSGRERITSFEDYREGGTFGGERSQVYPYVPVEKVKEFIRKMDTWNPRPNTWYKQKRARGIS